MPFKSKAQRGFMYANHPKIANKFEEHTPKGITLPEHVKKMADGGIINPQERRGMTEEAGHYADGGRVMPDPNEPGLQTPPEVLAALAALIGLPGGSAMAGTRTAGSRMAPIMEETDAIPSIGRSISTGIDTLSKYAPNRYSQGGEVVDSADKEFHSAMRKEGPMMNIPTQGYALGGEANDFQPVDPNDLPPAAMQLQQPSAPPAQAPAMQQMMQTLNQTKPTDPSIYQGVSADDRAKLYQRLLQQQNSTGNLIAQGVGGIGDAIVNSFGKGGSHTQDEARAIAEKNTENRMGAVDTQRAQKMQDFQAKQEQMLNDPSHPVAQSMRKMLVSQGINVPSGMNVNIMLKALGPMGEFAMKQATLGIQEEIAKNTQANQMSSRKLEAARGEAARPWYQKAVELVPGMKSDATTAMEEELKAKASSGANTVPHPQDNEAVQWAQQNPTDPRSVQILKLNGVQ